jgi:hypothetical protein
LFHQKIYVGDQVEKCEYDRQLVIVRCSALRAIHCIMNHPVRINRRVFGNDVILTPILILLLQDVQEIDGTTLNQSLKCFRGRGNSCGSPSELYSFTSRKRTPHQVASTSPLSHREHDDKLRCDGSCQSQFRSLLVSVNAGTFGRNTNARKEGDQRAPYDISNEASISAGRRALVKIHRFEYSETSFSRVWIENVISASNQCRSIRT